MSNQLSFKGFLVKPALGRITEVLNGLCEVVEVKLSFEVVRGLIANSKRQPTAIPGMPQWFVRDDSPEGPYIVYLPKNGLSGQESLVQKYFMYAKKCELVASFRLLRWHELASRRVRCLSMTPEEVVLFKNYSVERSIRKNARLYDYMGFVIDIPFDQTPEFVKLLKSSQASHLAQWFGSTTRKSPFRLNDTAYVEQVVRQGKLYLRFTHVAKNPDYSVGVTSEEIADMLKSVRKFCREATCQAILWDQRHISVR